MSHKSNQFPKVGLSILALFFLVACGKGGNGITMTEDEKISQKLNNYLLCTNNFSGDVLKSQKFYLEDVGDPMLPDEEIYGVVIYAIEKDPQICTAKIEIANAIDAENQLNPLADTYLKQLIAIKPILNKASRYYDQEDYLDDDYAQAKEMHETLLQAFENFEQAHKALMDEIETIQGVLDQQKMMELKENGNQLGYLDKKGIIEARELYNIGNVNHLDDLDLEQFTSTLETYEATVDEMVNYPAYNEYHDEYLTEAKELMRTKRENEYDDFSWDVDDFIDAYDDLINGPSGIIIGPDGVQIN